MNYSTVKRGWGPPVMLETSKAKHLKKDTSATVLELEDSILEERERLKSALGHAIAAT